MVSWRRPGSEHRDTVHKCEQQGAIFQSNLKRKGWVSRKYLDKFKVKVSYNQES